MAQPIRDRTLLGMLSIAIAAILAFLAFASQDPLPSVIAINVPIFLAWVTLGIFGGSAISLLSVIVILILELKSGVGSFHLLTASFLATTVAGYLCINRYNSLRNGLALKLEKTEEALILSANAIAEKNREMASFSDKMNRYSMLKNVVEALSESLSLDEVSRLVIDKAGFVVNKEGRILLFLVDTEKQELKLVASRGSSRVKEKLGDIFDHWVLRNRKSLIIEDATKDFRFPPQEAGVAEGRFRALISVPLISENKVIGILRMDSYTVAIYTQDDLRILNILSDLSALAIQNACLYAKTQELAIKDSLTGLAVRRHFVDRLKEEIKRSARKNTNLSVLMIDIDRFKDYNDRYGHLSGDLVLRHIAGILSSSVKEGDVVSRYGGEEFVVMLCGRDRSEAVAEAENVRNAIKRSPLKLRRQDANITVSIGVSCYPKDALLEEELVRTADDRLYKAKAGGRDKVC